MTDILLIYAVMQLMSTAFGLAVIGAVRSSIEEKLQDKGYVLKIETVYINSMKNLETF